MRQKIAAMVATTVILTGGALANATSASATVDPPSGGWDHTWTTSDSNPGGTAYIAEYGDIVSVCDTDADGVSPRVQIAVQYPSGAYHIRYTLTASGGEGACASARASQGGIYDLPEDTSISVAVWLGPDYGSVTTHYYVNDH